MSSTTGDDRGRILALNAPSLATRTFGPTGRDVLPIWKSTSCWLTSAILDTLMATSMKMKGLDIFAYYIIPNNAYLKEVSYNTQLQFFLRERHTCTFLIHTLCDQSAGQGRIAKACLSMSYYHQNLWSMSLQIWPLLESGVYPIKSSTSKICPQGRIANIPGVTFYPSSPEGFIRYMNCNQALHLFNL